MKINLSKRVDKNKYYNIMSDKHQIVIGHSYSDSIDYINKWETRCGGFYKHTVPFSIDIDGTIYQHFDPKYASTITGFDVDDNLIGINLVNEGSLTLGDNNEYFNSFRSIYNRELEPLNVEWRGKEYWAPYANEQMESLVELCKYLCEEFSINTTALTHNTKINSVSGLEGIVYKSNYSELYRDVSPAFDFNYLIENLKQYEIDRK